MGKHFLRKATIENFIATGGRIYYICTLQLHSTFKILYINDNAIITFIVLFHIDTAVVHIDGMKSREYLI